MPRTKRFDEEEVLTKAMRLFWKQGYAATSVQDLVAHLGINRASLYDTFGDKDRLFKQSFELYRKQSIQSIKKLFDEYSDVKEGFSRLFAQAIEEALEDKDKKGCFAVNTTTELVPNDASCQEILEANRLAFERLFYDYLHTGQQSGQLDGKNLRVLASMLYVTYNGLLVVTKIHTSKHELLEAANLTLSLLG
ncbi:TetR/AcrR family transcriptional regulator [Marinoscillum furvescens]|uniref:TetR family transcriptional regulator n=1 Tax=Marinoscillum furvescens DSM 4134 TaxID=1122208 RepID=A0A3D9LI34_MARFU|nr:TetR/AcrR family transcriptional regulator [Marinoscillum furvescens]REE05493.1 TetR family transcriptional regulator [Marinoscillum furvescens DSM 4134]